MPSAILSRAAISASAKTGSPIAFIRVEKASLGSGDIGEGDVSVLTAAAGSLGRCPRVAKTRSSLSPTRSTSASSKGRPASCKPIGKPALEKPLQIESAGPPRTLKTRLKKGVFASGAAMESAPSSFAVPLPVGKISMSNDSMTSA
jgi:hypothetical protein